jgi:hypothetical protein
MRCLHARQTADLEKQASTLNVCTPADVSDDARMLTCLMVVSHDAHGSLVAVSDGSLQSV